MKSLATGLLLLLPSLVIGSPAVAAAQLLPEKQPIQAVINHYIGQRLAKEKVTAAPIANAGTTLRRTTLDLAGRIPTTAETHRYGDSNAPQKREKLVDQLLASPDFAYHERNELDALLLARKKNDGNWRNYLLDATKENRPWDQMFREIMLGRADSSDKKPELEFLRARAKSIDDMTNDTSAIFFGVSIDCAKCHDHPLVSDWQQDHFFGLSSFFNRTYLTKKNILAEKNRGTIKFKTTEGEEKQAKFMFLSGSVVEEPVVEKTKEQIKAEDDEVRRQMKDDKAPPPKPPDFSPRAELVKLALRSGNNHFFAGAIVNRIWARLMGRGLVDPLNQMHSENPPSHPDLFEWLSRDLITHNYDLKRLIRGIVLSDAYARSSEFDGDRPADDYFAVAIPRPLSPRQYSLSLLIATTNPDIFDGEIKPDDWAKRRDSLENSSNSLASQIELPGEQFQISVDEALLFSNNNRIQNDYLRDRGDKLVGKLKSITDAHKLIETAFRAVLSRSPEKEELQAFEAYLKDRSDRPLAGIQQMVWALISSPELRFNY